VAVVVPVVVLPDIVVVLEVILPDVVVTGDAVVFVVLLLPHALNSGDRTRSNAIIIPIITGNLFNFIISPEFFELLR